VIASVRKTTLHRRAEIQQAALRLAFDVGPDRVTTGMIADQLGLTQPAIYKHFPNKEDIWSVVSEQLSKHIADNITRSKNTAFPPDVRLRILVMDHLRLVQEYPALPEIMVTRNIRDRKAVLRIRMQTSMAGFRKAILANVRAAVENGIFRADIDAGDAATLILGIIQSLALRMLVTRNPDILMEDGERLLKLQLSGFAQSGQNE
jgi:AcrR family transcriptional regulator